MPAKLAYERYRSLALWRSLWTALIFVLGLATTIFLIASIFLFVRESWIPGAVTTLASVLTGGAGGWLLARRQEAIDAETAAFREAITTAEEEEKRKRADSRETIAAAKEEEEKKRLEASRKGILGRK